MAASIEGDHRVRVAAERRERMLTRLLQAVQETYAGHVLSGPPTVEEVIACADVSRATFYKYFNSVDEAIESRASSLVDEMVTSLKGLMQPGMRPVLLFAVSVQLFLLRGVLDPTWAAFVARSDLLRADGVLMDGLNLHLAAASAEGEVHFDDAQAAHHLAIGAMREAMRSLAQTGSPRRGFVEEVTTLILIGLGLSRDSARLLVGEATIFIRGAGPDRLAWWRDPWAVAGTRG